MEYQVEDIVMVEIMNERPGGESRELLPKFKGPLKICKVLGNDQHEVKDLREGGRRTKTFVAVKRTKSWVAAIL